MSKRRHNFKLIGWFFGPALFVFMLSMPAPEGLPDSGWATAAVGCLMAVLWITEAIPIPVTSLLPLLLFPVLNIGSIGDAAAPYANPLIFLFMGGFMIAQAMQRWNLHRRIALNIIAVVGLRPRGVIAGFMVATAVLSMWVSNTATTMMMLPIALSVVGLAKQDEQTSRDAYNTFSIALMLSIAYAASIGGLGTLIGTPPNAVLAGFIQETYGYTIGFAQWMGIGLPLVLIGLPVSFLLIVHIIFPIRLTTLSGSRQFISSELKKLGSMTKPEKTVAAIFVSVAVFWMTRPLLASFIPGISDAGIAVFGAIVLFAFPVNLRKGHFLLDWETAVKLPWGILLLFGGGLSLALAISTTGLSGWIGEQMMTLNVYPPVLIVFVVTAVIITLTEFTSNTATAAAFLPIMGAVAMSVHQNPSMLAIPAAVASSCAFMLPVATPPNAIVYGSGVVTIAQMARAGLVLNIVFTVLITLLTFLLVPVIFNI
jgi:sodium-dependent dicarboxylate transporter 2/3/5